MKLSIVIPIGPGEPPPTKLIVQLGDQPSHAELILSATDHPDTAVPAGTQVLISPAGRGRQQNRGAAAASGEWLWFIHADSQLPASALTRALDFVERQPKVMGYCDLRFAADGPRLTRLNAIGANLRSRWLGLPYGDQGLCLPRDAFDELDGFREDMNRGEDLDFLVRARRAGLKVRRMGITMTTSSRRYREQGWLTTTWRHQLAAIRLARQAR